MSASAVYTIATIQLHVQTLLDPSVVRVTILLLEMEKRAGIPHQVNMSPSSCVAVQCLECVTLRYSEAQYILFFMLQNDICQM